MTINFTGTWKSKRESHLDIQVSNGNVSGKFESGIGDDGQTLWVDIEGRVQDDLITFNALYPKYGTVIAWVGQLREQEGEEIIEAHWLHVTNISDDQEQDWMWNTNRFGADVFSRVYV